MSSPPFSPQEFDVSVRNKTTAYVLWDVPPTTVRHADLITPNLAPIVREIAELPSWAPASSAVTFFFEHSRGDGTRWLESESTNNGIETPRLVLTSQRRNIGSTHDPWAILRHPEMKAKCAALITAAATGNVTDTHLHECYSRVSAAEAEEVYQCLWTADEDTKTGNTSHPRRPYTRRSNLIK